MWKKSTPLRLRAALRPRSRGQALVELALILPVLLVMVAGAIDVGRLFFAYVTIEDAAKEGALYGASNPTCDVSKAGCPDPSNVTYHLTQDLSGLSGVTSTIQCFDATTGSPVSVDSCAEDDTYRVTLSYPFTPITPLASNLVGGTLNITTAESAVVANGVTANPAPTPTPAPTASPTPTPTSSPTPTPSACVPPTVTFSGTPTNGSSSLSVTFTGTSSVTPISWQWNFGDGTNATGAGTPISATHTYTKVGNGTNWFDVTLTVNIGATCSTTITDKNYIKVQ